MLKSIRSTVAIAMVASAASAGAALASGEYYNGVSAQPAASVDLFQTSSVGSQIRNDRSEQVIATADQSVDHGDYYEGANRPQ